MVHFLKGSGWFATLALAVLAPAAHADLMSAITVNGCSSGCGSGPFGTVTVSQVDPDTVKVELTLSPDEVFAVTGSGSPFGYNLDESASLVAGTLTTGFALAGSKTFAGGVGTLNGTVKCTGCGNGTSSPELSGPVIFELTNAAGLTSADFVKNSKGFYFGADVGVENSSGTVAGTGPVGANKVTILTPVPEPGSVFLFATLLAGVLVSWNIRRRRGDAVSRKI